MLKNKVIILLLLIFSITGCGAGFWPFDSLKYSGNVNPGQYEWLKGRKIFLDPGHGGKGDSDLFRTGPGGITEEEINLKVALILYDMLKKTGADVRISRKRDVDISNQDRVDMVNEFNPDLFISIHHNGTARRADDVNYPLIFIWGNRQVRPLSYSFAEMLLEEFQNLIEVKGHIISDFSVYRETGTRVLRETRYTCPGVIGEFGFFSDSKHALRLRDLHYNTAEAEAYFYAIAEFFERGLPYAEVLISSTIANETFLYNMITDEKPVIAIKAYSGMEGVGIDRKSLNVTMDGFNVNYKAASDDLFIIDYGKKIYPGGHNLRFSFKNSRGQSSMIYITGFTLEIKKGDYDRLVSEGIRYLNSWRSRKEGLKMLLSAYSMSTTEPDAGRLLWNIARGFKLIGDTVNSEYYYAKLFYFYPQSRFSKKLSCKYKGYRFPVEYNGKYTGIKSEPLLLDCSVK
ncbi:MAG: N-acetylmuramoyl-L-alanine amidase [Spirochaetes bacterium]|nr:N-acetylmuramoyl-L-alanine amidase [Spirochaetota bacterium]